MSTTRLQEVQICFGFGKQTDIATANLVAAMWRLKKLNAQLANPKLNTENDAEEYGKGHEFATQTFKTSWDTGGTLEKYLSAEMAAWAMCFGLGKVTKAGTTNLTVHADGGDLKANLSLAVRVQSAASGSISLNADFPKQKGTSSTSFTFNLTLKNDTPSEVTYSFNSTGPNGWTVSTKPAGQSQATSLTVAAGSTGSLSTSVSPSSDATAGDYPVVVTVSGGGKTAEADLTVTITGSYSLSLSTPDQVLSTTANAGTEKDFVITLTNTGTAPITQITPSATAPTGWKVTFTPATIASLAPGATATQNVTAAILPSSDAIAGDYSITMTATGAEASASQAIRVTVQTPQFWWIAGVVLLLATFAGLYWVFRTYGRR